MTTTIHAQTTPAAPPPWRQITQDQWERGEGSDLHVIVRRKSALGLAWYLDGGMVIVGFSDGDAPPPHVFANAETVINMSLRVTALPNEGARVQVTSGTGASVAPTLASRRSKP